MTKLNRIVVAAHSPLPYLTAAQALGQGLSLPVQHHDRVQPDAINLGPPSFASQV
ncbi:MAG: hypothetical protein HN904_05395, partial [Victivallales bacterium]|nr:hypothetical protein [Victivallales bacterium]